MNGFYNPSATNVTKYIAAGVCPVFTSRIPLMPLTEQKINAACSLAGTAVGGLLDFLEAGSQSALALVSNLVSQISYDDVDAFRNFLIAWVNQDYKVIILAHSQGNAHVMEALKLINRSSYHREKLAHIGVIMMGSPIDESEMRAGQVVRFDNCDDDISLLSNFSSTNCYPSITDEESNGHGFLTAYMNDSPESHILSTIRKMKATLPSPTEETVADYATINGERVLWESTRLSYNHLTHTLVVHGFSPTYMLNMQLQFGSVLDTGSSTIIGSGGGWKLGGRASITENSLYGSHFEASKGRATLTKVTGVSTTVQYEFSGFDNEGRLVTVSCGEIAGIVDSNCLDGDFEGADWRTCGY